MKLPRRIPWLAVAALAVVIPACVGALAGCASMGYEWRQAHPPAPKPWRYVVVPDVDRFCRGLPMASVKPERIMGCATWRADGCTIYTGPNPPAWVLAHEEKHCEGSTHN